MVKVLPYIGVHPRVTVQMGLPFTILHPIAVPGAIRRQKPVGCLLIAASAHGSASTAAADLAAIIEFDGRKTGEIAERRANDCHQPELKRAAQ